MDENREDRRGNMKRRIKGRRDVRIEDADCGGSFSPRGLLCGLPPPNWWTRTPGPPPRLNTKPGPPPIVVVSMRSIRRCGLSCTESHITHCTATKELSKQLLR